MAVSSDGWGTEFGGPDAKDAALIEEAKKRFKICVAWEATARIRFDYDYKFANGDTHNKYQWDSQLVYNRELVDRPCLTVNKTAQHNFLIINDAKQNKPGVRIRPVSDEATFDGAQIFQEVIYHIEYISNAENVYDYGTSYQVKAGWGYWRVATDYISSKSFDQEIYIRRIKDPMSVYIDPDINEADGSDARYAFIFEDMSRDLFNDKYPDFKDKVGFAPLGNYSSDIWLTEHHVRVAEYYTKSQKDDKYVSYHDPDENQDVEELFSDLTKEQKEKFKLIKQREGNLPIELQTYRERKVLTDNIEWYKIAGDHIIERGPWLGKYIPVVRLMGTETVINGEWDCCGHTRSLINPQQIYNYNTSANVEYGALQTKSPWLCDTEAIEGYEEFYKTANTVNRSYLPHKTWSEDGRQLPPPTRPQAPQASPAYVEQLKIAQNEMMMASGQYQAQMGENENAKSGVAINARQRQGDRSTYHFIDNLAIAVRFTGKILLDLIPKIYDTQRVKRIEGSDGTLLEVTIDPNATQAIQDITNPNNPIMDKGRIIKQVIFNPGFGYYDLQADSGPSFATRRMEAFNALTQIAAQNKEFMGVAGDILWKVADFPEAQVLAERWRKIIPPNITGDAPNPALTQAMQQASEKIEQQLAIIAKQAKDLADKDRELTQKGQDLDLRLKEATSEQARLDYDSETKRLVALGNSGPSITVEQIQPILMQLLKGMKITGEPDIDEKKDANELDSVPGIEGSRQAPDGSHYVKHTNGQYMKVVQQ